MLHLHTCPSGHQWKSDDASDRCPVCAAAAESVREEDASDWSDGIDELPPPPSGATVRRPPDSAPTMPPQALRDLPRVAGYELLAEIGRGGMGVVYRARHLRLNRLVALKMLLGGEHAGAEQFARFRTEAEAVARLHHPNIVQIFEIGEANGLPYLALELVEGDNLSHRLRTGPLPGPVAAAIAESLARAIQHAHDREIIHRDLKPGNVLLSAPVAEHAPPRTADGRASTREHGPETAQANPQPVPAASADVAAAVKITDFGLAKQIGSAAQTTTGVAIGTPSYMAPEQVTGLSAHLGPAVDVYALGAILYEMLTGRPPFLAATPMETFRQVLHQDVIPPRRVQPALPRDLETICLKCLRKEARKRYASAGDLAEDLRRFRAGEPITARPVGHFERGWRWCRRNRTVASLIAAAVVLLVAGTAVSVRYAVKAGDREELASRNADLATGQARRAIAGEQAADAARREAEQILVEGLLLPVGGTPDPTDPEIKALGKVAALPRDDVRVLFARTAFDDPTAVQALAHRTDETIHAAVGLSASRRARTAAILLDRLRTSASEETRVACIRAAGLLRDPDPELARLSVTGALDLLDDPMHKKGGFAEASIDDLVALVGTLTPADRAAISQTARTKLLDGKGDRRFVILAAFVAASTAEEAAPLVKELVPRLEKVFASLTAQQDVRLLERAVRTLAPRLTRADAAKLAAAIAECAARTDLGTEARLVQDRRRSLARALSHTLPRLPGEEAAALAGKVVPLLATVAPPLVAEEVQRARVTLALARFLPADERARTAAAAAVRVSALFIQRLEPKQQLLPVADFLIDLKSHLAEPDAKQLVQDCLKAAQNVNRDPHSFHALVAVLAAYRDRLTTDERKSLATRLIERKPEVPLFQSRQLNPERINEVADEADLLTASAAFATDLPREYLEALRPVLTDLVAMSSEYADPRLRIATARALAALGPALRLDPAGAVPVAHTLLRERDGLSIANGYQRTEDGDLVLDAFCRLFPLFTDQQLIDVMKQPLCRRVERGRIARELGRRHARDFRTVWEMIAWAEAQQPPLDLTSPPVPITLPSR